MKIDRFKVLKPGFKLIDIDSGGVKPMNVGDVHFVEHAEGKAHLAYYVLVETRIGSIERHWLDSEADGFIQLFKVAEADDLTLDGILLPVTSGSVFTEHQKTHLVIGHLVKGKFKCTRCTLKHGLTYPDAIAVYPVNILPYSQNCTECGIQILDIWKSSKGGCLNLFD